MKNNITKYILSLIFVYPFILGFSILSLFLIPIPFTVCDIQSYFTGDFDADFSKRMYKKAYLEVLNRGILFPTFYKKYLEKQKNE